MSLNSTDPDPELTRLNTIPVIYPILRGSLNLPPSARDTELQERLDPEHLLTLCLRYQEHLKQLAESVAFDQNALCIRIKEVNQSAPNIEIPVGTKYSKPVTPNIEIPVCTKYSKLICTKYRNTSLHQIQ